jgi:deferrochelatase/peroxidase EfeB
MVNSVRQFLSNPDTASLRDVLVQLVQTIAENLSRPHRHHGAGNLFLPDEHQEDVLTEQLRNTLVRVVDLSEDDLFDLSNALSSFDRTLQQLAAHHEDSDRRDYEYVLSFFTLTPGYYLGAATRLAWALDEFYVRPAEDE